MGRGVVALMLLGAFVLVGTVVFVGMRYLEADGLPYTDKVDWVRWRYA